MTLQLRRKNGLRLMRGKTVHKVMAEEEWGKKETSRQQVVHAECANANGSRCYLGKESLETQGTYLERENLCTIVEPRCGGASAASVPFLAHVSHIEKREN